MTRKKSLLFASGAAAVSLLILATREDFTADGIVYGVAVIIFVVLYKVFRSVR